MERLKSNWKFVACWFVVMSITNIYIIPTFVEHEPVTTKRILVGLMVSLISGVIMGLITPKPKDNLK